MKRWRLADMNARTRLFDSPVGLVENVVCAASSRRQGGEDFSPDFQVAIPYRGVFIWHVGNDAVVGDANQILFVTGGEAYRASNPRPGGYAELIITPSMSGTVRAHRSGRVRATEASAVPGAQPPGHTGASDHVRTSPPPRRATRRLRHAADG